MCSNSLMPDVRMTTSTLEFPYSRTTGPVVGGFLRALAEGRLLGVRDRSGRVIVPPVEYDLHTGESLSDDMVEVATMGTVVAWTWVAEPLAKHPLDHPFAFALVRPDGADTAMVHAVDCGSPEAMSTGMRVAARFATEPTGLVTDLVAWTPVPA